MLKAVVAGASGGGGGSAEPFNFRGLWAAPDAYEPLDLVRWQGALYEFTGSPSDETVQPDLDTEEDFWRLWVPAGAPGASAYVLAVADGFVGSESEYLSSLIGPPGPAYVFTGEWNAATYYEPYQLVTWAGALYLYNTSSGDGTTQPDLDTAHDFWQLMIPAAEGGGGGGGTFVVAEPGTYAPPLAVDFPIMLDPVGKNPTFVNTLIGAIMNVKAYGSGPCVTGYLKAVPVATPYKITARILYSLKGGFAVSAGLVLRNSVNGRMFTTGLLSLGDTWSHQADRWDSPLSHGGNIGGDLAIAPGCFWCEMRNDGVNISSWFSADKETWTKLGQQAMADFLGTPDQVGFQINTQIAGDGEPGLAVTYYEDDDYPAKLPTGTAVMIE